MKTKILPILAVIILLISCEKVNVATKTEKTPVIEAFIMPQKDTITVSVKYMIPYTGTDTIQMPVSGVPVFLIHKKDTVLMTEYPDSSGEYRVLSSKLNFKPGDSIGLYGLYEDAVFRSATRIPDSIQSLAISTSSLFFTGDPKGMMDSGGLTITWSNPASDYYYVIIENTETSPTPLNDMVADLPSMSFAAPSQADQFQVSMRNIRYYGKHRVIVFHINPEFADLFDNAELTSNAITQPPGNVENAMGIFTALTADTVYFTVYKN
jgi:hypothetical protein